MHIYRSNTCGTLSSQDEGKTVRLSGWVFRLRDHGNRVFIDLRDSTGIIQLVGDAKQFASISLESVICVTGVIHKRSLETINKELATGSIELHVEIVQILSKATVLPMSINKQNANYPEDFRLKYRYLDLRRDEVRANMILRIKIISYLRTIMNQFGFLECQTPILTVSSPEGARDFLVPSRLHVGKFYALPQAPQQFKQLLMVAGFDRYFQISPCFRDEDARADRSPGEFYQLDIEMSFVTQEDIFQIVEDILYNVFSEFSSKKITSSPFPRITYHDAIENYGSDKPDLRNPLRIVNVTEIFRNSSFHIFASAIESGAIVRAIFVANITESKRKIFDELNEWAKTQELSGLAYLIYKKGLFIGTIAKYLSEDYLKKLINLCNQELHDGVIFFMCDYKKHLEKRVGLVRTKLAETFQLIDDDSFEFLWVVDFPMYELNEKTGNIQFSHNPFSMPQGGMESLCRKNPLDILAYQYDIICNGIELSSGAIRNHLLDILYKAFEIAGYSHKCVDKKFPSIIEAFQFGVPPHGGCAPGIDRIVMLLAGAKNLREIILFPFNQMGEDLMMRAPSYISEQQLKELGLLLIESKN